MMSSSWINRGLHLQRLCVPRLFTLLPGCGRRLMGMSVILLVLFGLTCVPEEGIRAAPVPKKKEPEKFVIQLLPKGFHVPSTVYRLRLHRKGTLRDIDFGKQTYEGLRSFWSTATEDQYLLLTVEYEDTTSVALLGDTLTHLRAASNPSIKTTVYVRLNSWAREAPPTKGVPK
jgi:hypothetical protein